MRVKLSKRENILSLSARKRKKHESEYARYERK
jgi:hypothetical protein